MHPQTQIHGKYDNEFNRVKEFFQEHVEHDKEIDASVAVTLDGKPVVNLWAGFADEKRTSPWQRDTLVDVFSTTKGSYYAACISK